MTKYPHEPPRSSVWSSSACSSLGVWLVNAVFTQKFISFDNVTLKTDTIGLQLPEQADVKVRGVIVGQVHQGRVRAATGATLDLGIKPDQISTIPANVTAAILPKTLFGEKYVELNIPKDADSTSLKAGDTIDQTKLPDRGREGPQRPLPAAAHGPAGRAQLHAERAGRRPRGPRQQARREPRDPRRLPQEDEPPAAGADRRHQAARQGHRHLRRRHPGARRDPAQHREDRQHAGLQGGEAATRSSRTPRRSPTPPRRS